MKTLGVILFTGLAITLQAQYKAPSQYFRKDFPAPKPNAAQPPQPHTQPPPQQHAVGTPQSQPAQAPQPPQQKFKDVGTNSQFFFLTDTNRAYPWTKISATVATNTKNGARQSFSPEMPIQQ